MEILKLPELFPFIKTIDVTHFEEDEEKYFVRFILTFKDGTQLFCKDFFNSVSSVHDYAFHWQDKKGKLINRWDNSLYHKKVSTHPFHIHTPEGILPSKEMYIEDVLMAIEVEMKK